MILLPPVLSTQDTIGSTYIGIKDVANLYSTKLEYKWSSNEIIMENDYNRISINEDGYIGIKNGGKVFYLPSKIYHKDSVIYTPVELINYLDEYENITEVVWDEDFSEGDYSELIMNNDEIKYVVIDPGHGGKDPGAVSGEIYEKNIVIQIAYKLKNELEKRNSNIRIVMTRTEDKELDKNKSKDLRMRAELGSKRAINHPTIYVSIHVNATPIKENYETTKGVETWYYMPEYSKKTNEDTLNYRKKWIKNVYKTTLSEASFKKTAMISNIDKNIGLNSKKLAGIIHNSLLDNVSKYTENRQIKKGVFQVLRESVVPAVLCEVGFLTNSKERQLLISDEYQKKIAEGLADGILSYFSAEDSILSMNGY